jgi:hypothetical protein
VWLAVGALQVSGETGSPLADLAGRLAAAAGVTPDGVTRQREARAARETGNDQDAAAGRVSEALRAAKGGTP